MKRFIFVKKKKVLKAKLLWSASNGRSRWPEKRTITIPSSLAGEQPPVSPIEAHQKKMNRHKLCVRVNGREMGRTHQQRHSLLTSPLIARLSGGKCFIPLLIPASGLIQLVTKSLWMRATQAGLGHIIIHKLACALSKSESRQTAWGQPKATERSCGDNRP